MQCNMHVQCHNACLRLDTITHGLLTYATNTITSTDSFTPLIFGTIIIFYVYFNTEGRSKSGRGAALT